MFLLGVYPAHSLRDRGEKKEQGTSVSQGTLHKTCENTKYKRWLCIVNEHKTKDLQG